MVATYSPLSQDDETYLVKSGDTVDEGSLNRQRDFPWHYLAFICLSTVSSALLSSILVYAYNSSVLINTVIAAIALYTAYQLTQFLKPRTLDLKNVPFPDINIGLPMEQLQHL